MKTACHGWLLDGEIVCLDKSFSKQREQGGKEREYALANKMLHWLDFVSFGQKGYKYMYMGGLGTAEYEPDEEAKKIAYFKNNLIKRQYRKEVLYYSIEIDCKQCRANKINVHKTLGHVGKKRYVIYGYGILGVAVRLVCFEKGAEIRQIVDKYVAENLDYVDDELLQADGNSLVIVAAVKFAEEIKGICLEKGYSEEEILCPFK